MPTLERELSDLTRVLRERDRQREELSSYMVRLLELLENVLGAVESIDRKLQSNREQGSGISLIGDFMSTTLPMPDPLPEAKGSDAMVAISPGNSPKFKVTPSFSGDVFTLNASQASVTSSDTTNFPVEIDTSDPQGTTIVAHIPKESKPSGPVTVTWSYTNTDGTKAEVTGTVTETGITDDVTGGSFAQVS